MSTFVDLNILVGKNDDGKSNILRALNLFFNGAKPNGYVLDWERDYSACALTRANKAKEITIELEINLPASFAEKKAVTWKKIWRREGLHEEVMTLADGSPIPGKSKIRAFIDSIRYDYVPAIKGADYFKHLLAQMHDMLETTVEEEIRKASSSFTRAITQNTGPIMQEIETRLGFNASIALPRSLRDLFAQLEFNSQSGNMSFTLDQRGDGIKARHIPIILSWLAGQSNHLAAKGRPRVVTVWGYEEPENNLEILRCLELARTFVEQSSNIQSFVTTHSPAFYSVWQERNHNTVGLFHVKKDPGSFSTTVECVRGTTELEQVDSSLGLLALIEPHLRSSETEMRRLREINQSLRNRDTPTIFCEGPTDELAIKTCLDIFCSSNPRITVECNRIQGGGHSWVADMVIAWSHSRTGTLAVGLFDKDGSSLN